MKEINEKGLSSKERKELRDYIKDAMCIKYSKNQGIYYYYGSKVNDIESSTNVFAYLKKTNPRKRFVFLCYLREDRPERTESFLPFFETIYKDDRVERIYFTGSGLGHVKDDNKVIKKKNLTHREVIEFCRKRKLVLFTAVNGVNDFIQKLETILEK